MSPSAESYLILALRELDECAIPGLGVFRKISSPARSTADGKGLLPPASTLTFEASDTGASPLLAEYLCSRHQLSEPEANHIMSDIKIEMMWALETKRKYDIAGLGLLMRSAEGNTIFVPHESADPLGEQYGLLPIDMPPAQEPAAHAPKMPPPLPKPAPAPPRTAHWVSAQARFSLLILFLVGFTGFSLYMAFRNAPARLETAGATPTDTNRLFGRSRQLAAPAATTRDQSPAKQPAVSPPIASAERPTTASTNTAPTVAPSPLSAPETATRGIEADPRQVMRTMRGGNAATEEYGVVGSLDDLANSIAATTLPAATRGIGESVYPYPQSTARYHLIGGSFTDAGQANAAMAEARALGLSPLILFPANAGERYRISLVQGDEKTAVRKKANSLKNEGHFKNAWVLELP